MGTLVTLILLALYFLPTIIVLNNKGKVSKFPTILTNFFFGLTIIGWFVALIMSTGKDSVATVVINNGQTKE